MIDAHGLVDDGNGGPRRQPGILVPEEYTEEMRAFLDAPRPGVVRFNLGRRIDQDWLPMWASLPDPDEDDDVCCCGTEMRDHPPDNHGPVGMHAHMRSLRVRDVRIALGLEKPPTTAWG